MNRNIIKGLAMVGVAAVAPMVHAAPLTAAASPADFLAAIDLADANTIVLSVGAGLAAFGALYLAVRKGLRFLGM